MVQNSDILSSNNNLTESNRRNLEKVFRHKQIFKRNIRRVSGNEYLIYVKYDVFHSAIHAIRKQN